MIGGNVMDKEKCIVQLKHIIKYGMQIGYSSSSSIEKNIEALKYAIKTIEREK